MHRKLYIDYLNNSLEVNVLDTQQLRNSIRFVDSLQLQISVILTTISKLSIWGFHSNVHSSLTHITKDLERRKCIQSSQHWSGEKGSAHRNGGCCQCCRYIAILYTQETTHDDVFTQTWRGESLRRPSAWH